ncbi:hypothetical protein J5Y03_01335 [Bacillus sp. RG28]|uniref:Uncharacterized protein n=1 Tax=Gottfriedia endophytica TaxID=2820819 RepID=A0A940NRZ9_9BACI|nr:hypothetical protein [Gottfriedia endophytica]MBP0723823.1 hypothetical protein [Gottfriedia endophytica]
MHSNLLHEFVFWFLLILTLLLFYLGVKRKKPVLILLSGFASIPFTYYLYIKNNTLKLICIVPILLFIYSFILYKQKKHYKDDFDIS